jgi:hypothetical protein
MKKYNLFKYNLCKKLTIKKKLFIIFLIKLIIKIQYHGFFILYKSNNNKITLILYILSKDYNTIKYFIVKKIKNQIMNKCIVNYF